MERTGFTYHAPVTIPEGYEYTIKLTGQERTDLIAMLRKAKGESGMFGSRQTALVNQLLAALDVVP